MDMKSILFLVPNHYMSHLKVASHYYAEALSRDGNDVTFVSDPLTLFHLCKHGLRKDNRYFHARLSTIRMKTINGIKVVTASTFLPVSSLIDFVAFCPGSGEEVDSGGRKKSPGKNTPGGMVYAGGPG